MNHTEFCGEYMNETRSGRISFSKRNILRFVKKYTHLDPDLLTKEMIFRIGLTMIDYYDDFMKDRSRLRNQPENKIELPEWIFK